VCFAILLQNNQKGFIFTSCIIFSGSHHFIVFKGSAEQSTMSIFFVKNIDDEINTALLKQPVDIETLRKLSRRKGGFVNSRNRTRIWPKLLAVNRYTIPDYRSFIDPHRDDSQVRCDVDRSLWNFNHIKHWKEAFREKRRKALSDIIMSILCRNPTLYYYQVNNHFHVIISINNIFLLKIGLP
jgi:hypothetical protein